MRDFSQKRLKGFIGTERFATAFGLNHIDFEIWTALDLGIDMRTQQHFEELPKSAIRLRVVLAELSKPAHKQPFDLQLSFVILRF